MESSVSDGGASGQDKRRPEEETVSAVIIAWNAGDEIAPCLASLLAQTRPPDEIILVDNGSSDETVEKARACAPVVLIRNAENLGFCRAGNQGMAAARGGFILLLNTDVILEKDFLEQLVRAMRRSRSAGMGAGKVLRMGSKTRRIDSTGISLGPWHLDPHDRGSGEIDRGQYDNRAGGIVGPTGAAAFYRRRMLDSIAPDRIYFDETFGSYYEDVDLAWRAHNRGWRCLYVPGAVAYHGRRGTAHKPLYTQLHALKNKYLCYLKNERTGVLLAGIPVFCFTVLIRGVRCLCLRPEVIRALPLALSAWARALAKRNDGR